MELLNYIFLSIIILLLIIRYTILMDNYDKKGDKFLYNGDFDNAIKYFTKSKNLFNLGLCLMKKGDYNKAILFFQKDLIKNSEWFGKQYYYIGYCYEKINDYLNSFINYSKYIEINNKVPFYITDSSILNEMSPNGNIESNYDYKNLDMSNFLQSFYYMKKSIKNNENLEFLDDDEIKSNKKDNYNTLNKIEKLTEDLKSKNIEIENLKAELSLLENGLNTIGEHPILGPLAEKLIKGEDLEIEKLDIIGQ